MSRLNQKGRKCFLKKGWSVGLRCQMRAEKCQLAQTAWRQATSELSQSCFDEVKWAEIRSLWIEKCKLSKRKQKVQATIPPRVIVKSMTPFLLLLLFLNSLGVTVKTSCEGCHLERLSIHLELILHPALGEAPGNQTIPLPAFPVQDFQEQLACSREVQVFNSSVNSIHQRLPGPAPWKCLGQLLPP